jgi:hypothetical protein
LHLHAAIIIVHEQGPTRGPDLPLTLASPSPVIMGRMVWWESAAAPNPP